MKTFLISSSLAIASLAAPQLAFANESAPAASEIIVSGEFKKDWARGSKMEADGLRDLQKAQKNLVKHSADVVNAQDLRDTSQSRADNARATFDSLVARPMAVDADDARKWAKQVDSAASDWQKFEDRRDKGVKDLAKAQKRAASAQAAVDKAQAKIDAGRNMMADAERASTVLATS